MIVVVQLKGNKACEPSGVVDTFAALALACLNKERPVMLTFHG
jgi:hypothetical protein